MRSNYQYNGVVPEDVHFINFGDTEEDKEKKKKDLEQMRKNNCVWNFKREIQTYTENDVKMLCQGIFKFIGECMDLQLHLHDSHRPSPHVSTVLHPFDRNFVSPK